MIGLFIGSFNPPTKAHIDITLKLKDELEKIILVPVNSNEKNLINIYDRINMLTILKKKYPFLEISTIMKKYAYFNYRLIDLLKQEYSNIKIIMGSDLLENFNRFDNYKYLLENYSFIIVPRNKVNTEKIIKDYFDNYQDKFKILDYQSDISSTMVRKMLKEKQNVESLLDSDVLNYIYDKHLY